MSLAKASAILLLILAACAACSEADPLMVRLAHRSHYQVDVVSFSPRDNGRLLVELEVRAGMGEHLKRITATIHQHSPAQDILVSDRVTLDLSQMDATGVIRVYADINAAPGELGGLSSTIERTPDAADYDQFPEIMEVMDS